MGNNGETPDGENFILDKDGASDNTNSCLTTPSNQTSETSPNTDELCGSTSKLVGEDKISIEHFNNTSSFQIV